MGNTISVKKAIISIIVVAFFTLGCFMILPSLSDTYQTTVSAEEEEKDPYNYSLNEISLILSAYVDDGMKPNSENEDNRPSGIKSLDDGAFDGYGDFDVGDAGAFIGYRENGWLSSLVTNASSNYKYSSFEKMIVNGSGDKDEHSRIMRYMQYGYMLNQMGLDTTGDEGFLATAGGFIVGGPILFVYIISLGVPVMFSIIITILQFLNPFRLFEAKLGKILNDNDFSFEESQSDGLMGTNFMRGLSSMVGDWYEMLFNLSWEIIVPIMFFMLIVSALLFRQAWSQTGRKKIKNYVIRIVFLMVGIPVCGATYTAALNGLAKAASGDNAAATRVIASTFVDFESWANKGRLSPVFGAYIAAEDNESESAQCTPSSLSLFNTRSTAYYINRAWSYGHANLSGASPFGTSDDMTDAADWNTNISNESSSDANTKARSNLTNIGNTLDMLLSFMSAESFTASEYESDVKATLSTMATQPKYSFFINDLFEMSGERKFYYAKGADNSDDCSDDEYWQRLVGAYRFRSMYDFFVTNDTIKGEIDDFIKERNEDAKDRENRASASGGDYMPNIFANGGLQFNDILTISDKSSNGYLRYLDKHPSWNDGGAVDSVEDWRTSDSAEHKAQRLCSEYGLSTMSMFNYLNTVFTSTGVTTYSSDRSASLFTRDTHRSVSLVGTGFMSVLYWLNAFVLIGAFCVIGYCYSVCILFGNIKRSARLIASVPGAMLGSIKSIGRVVAYTVIMILEVLGTMVAYFLVTELLMDLSGLIEAPFVNALSDKYSMSVMNPALVMNSTVQGDMASGAFTFVLLCLAMLLSVLLTVWFTITALRWRKKIVRTLDEAATSIIDRLFDTNTGAANVGGSKIKAMAGKAAGAVTTGAGMAMGNKLANGALGGALGGGTSPDGMSSIVGGAAPGADGGDGGAGGGDGSSSIAMTGRPDLPSGGGDETAEGDTVNGGDTNNDTESSGDENAISTADNSNEGSTDVVGASFDGDNSEASNEEDIGKSVAAGDSLADGDNAGPVNISDNDGDDADGADGDSGDGITAQAEQAGEQMGNDVVAGAVESVNDSADMSDGSSSAESSTGDGSSSDGAKSALMDEKEADRAAELKKEHRKEAVKNAAEGTVQAGKGAAEAYIGAQTGNAQMTSQGVQDMQAGSQKTSEAGKDFAQAGKKGEQQAHAERQQAEAKQRNAQAGGSNQAGNSNNSSNVRNNNNSSNSHSSSNTASNKNAKNVVNNGGNSNVTANNRNMSNQSNLSNSVNKGNMSNQSHIDKGKGGDINESVANNLAGDNKTLRGGNVENKNTTSVKNHNTAKGQSGQRQARSGNGNSPQQRPTRSGNGNNGQRRNTQQSPNGSSMQSRPQGSKQAAKNRPAGGGNSNSRPTTRSSSQGQAQSVKVLKSNSNNSGGFIGGGSSSMPSTGSNGMPSSSGGSTGGMSTGASKSVGSAASSGGASAGSASAGGAAASGAASSGAAIPPV